jgi:hypothetical protein
LGVKEACSPEELVTPYVYNVRVCMCVFVFVYVYVSLSLSLSIYIYIYIYIYMRYRQRREAVLGYTKLNTYLNNIGIGSVEEQHLASQAWSLLAGFFVLFLPVFFLKLACISFCRHVFLMPFIGFVFV